MPETDPRAMQDAERVQPARAKPEPAEPIDRRKLAEAVADWLDSIPEEKHDWAEALYAAALDEYGDPWQALEAAKEELAGPVVPGEEGNEPGTEAVESGEVDSPPPTTLPTPSPEDQLYKELREQVEKDL